MPTFIPGGAAGGGASTFVAEFTATTAAQLDILFDTSFDRYVIYYGLSALSAGTLLQARTGTGTGTVFDGDHAFVTRTPRTNDATSSYSAGANLNDFVLTGTIPNTAGIFAEGVITVNRLGSASENAIMMYSTAHHDGAVIMVTSSGSARRINNETIDTIRITPGSGTLSMVARLYGIANS